MVTVAFSMARGLKAKKIRAAMRVDAKTAQLIQDRASRHCPQDH